MHICWFPESIGVESAQFSNMFLSSLPTLPQEGCGFSRFRDAVQRATGNAYSGLGSQAAPCM